MQQRIENLLAQDWTLAKGGNQLCRAYTLKDFATAFELMTRVAEKAKSMDHHPDWSNSYNKLSICLTTHSLGVVTSKDVELAEFIEQQAQTMTQATPPTITD